MAEKECKKHTKREAITSIESLLQVTSYFDGIQKAEYTCSQVVTAASDGAVAGIMAERYVVNSK